MICGKNLEILESITDSLVHKTYTPECSQIETNRNKREKI